MLDLIRAGTASEVRPWNVAHSYQLGLDTVLIKRIASFKRFQFASASRYNKNKPNSPRHSCYLA